MARMAESSTADSATTPRHGRVCRERQARSCGLCTGRERLGLVDERFDILVIEDSPAGIAAGKAAGCRVIGLLTSHTYKQIASSKPDWILQDLRSLKILRNTNGKVVVEMSIVRREA